MANAIEVNLQPDERTLRQFGFIALIGFGLIAGLAWHEVLVFSFGLGAAREPVAYGFGAVAVGSLLLSLVYPKANLPLYLGMTILTYPIGFVLSYLVLGTIFYLIIAHFNMPFSRTMSNCVKTN